MPGRSNTGPRPVHPAVRAVLREWRALTGGRAVRDAGRRTILAVSGGADSAALLVALASRPREVVVAHVIHDMRPRVEANADRDFVRDLCGRFGLTFCEAIVRPRRAGGNAEAAARRLRYRALVRLAAAHRCPYIATAHHAGDLAETIVMRLLRGAGPRGLGSIRAVRRLGSATVIRPLLPLTRADTEGVCTHARVQWRHDATNADTSRLRAAVRYRVMPVLRELAPGVERRAARTAALCLDAAGLIRSRARRILAKAVRGPRSLRLSRDVLRHQRPVVSGEVIRCAVAEVSPRRGSVSARMLAQVLAAVRDQSTEVRRFSGGPARIDVTAREVLVSRAPLTRRTPPARATRSASAAPPRRPS